LLVRKGPRSRLTQHPSGHSFAYPPGSWHNPWLYLYPLATTRSAFSPLSAEPPCCLSIPTCLLLPAQPSRRSIRSALLRVSSAGWPVGFTGTIGFQRYVRCIECGCLLVVVIVYRYRVKDVDILCLDCRWDQEELKRRVVAANPSFYLVPSKTPGATYKVLWYRNYNFRRCKVDLLLPGIMNIPSVPIAAIDYSQPGNPCAPFALVFLLKLQAWQQHKDSGEMRFRIKSSTDALDLRRMLPIAIAKGFRIQRKEAYLPSSFVASAAPRVNRFVRELPETLHWWRDLGFSVREEKKSHELQRFLF